MLPDAVRENDDVVVLYEARFLFEAGEDDLQSGLESCRGVSESKWNVIILEFAGLAN